MTLTDRALRFALGLLLAAASPACDDASDAAPADAAIAADAQSDAGAGDAALPMSVRGVRYCEILLIYAGAGGIDAQVWGTQGLNLCPPEQWTMLDADTLRAETGATLVLLNGPRYWLIDAVTGELPPGEPRRFGELEMHQLATIALQPGMMQSMPYAERTVNRSSRFTFRAGSEIYELLAPDGATYVMQSYAQIVDPTLSEAELPTLGARLELPDGWTYRARTLDAELVVDTPDGATVLQDELQNSYSLYGEGG